MATAGGGTTKAGLRAVPVLGAEVPDALRVVAGAPVPWPEPAATSLSSSAGVFNIAAKDGPGPEPLEVLVPPPGPEPPEELETPGGKGIPLASYNGFFQSSPKGKEKMPAGEISGFGSTLE